MLPSQGVIEPARGVKPLQPSPFSRQPVYVWRLNLAIVKAYIGGDLQNVMKPA
jgi:hypothetical protein